MSRWTSAELHYPINRLFPLPLRRAPYKVTLTWTGGGAAMITRRAVLASGAAALAGCATGSEVRAPTSFTPYVARIRTGFRLGGQPYRYAGANMWYGAWLGADAPYGNRDRLRRELDRLVALGVTNIRALAGSEDSPL